MMNLLRIPLLTLIVAASCALAQSSLGNARAYGMGGAYLMQAAGVEAVRWNPANLGLRDTPEASLLFAAFGIGVSNNAFNQTDYNLYNGAKLSAADKAAIMQRLPASGWNFNASTSLEVLGVSYRNFAFMFGVEAASEANLPRDVVDLFLNGNALNRSYDFAGAQGSGFALACVGVSYGHALRLPRKSVQFAVGGTVKYLHGLGFIEMTQAGGYALTAVSGISGEAQAQARLASGGNGLGIDLGASAIVRRQWRLGLTVHNAFATMTWQRNVRRYEYRAQADSLTLVAVEDNENAVFGNASQKKGGAGFSISLPPVLHLGASCDFNGVIASADFVQGLRRAYGVSSKPELRAGVEMNVVPALSTRAGVRVGGPHKLGASIGFGLHAGTFNFDLAAGALGGVVPLLGKGVGVALSVKVVK